MESDLRPGGDLDELADWGNKLCGSVAWLSGLIHVLQHSRQSHPWATDISPETMANAIKLGKYFKEHAKAAFLSMGADLRLVSAKKVWAVIGRDYMNEFSVRDLYQKVRRSFTKVADLEDTLGLLVDYGYVRALPTPKREGQGQHPSPRYEVNPLARTQNTRGTQNNGPADVAMQDLDSAPNNLESVLF